MTDREMLERLHAACVAFQEEGELGPTEVATSDSVMLHSDLLSALDDAQAHLSSPPTVDPAVKRWQEVDSGNQARLIHCLRHGLETEGPENWHAASALEALAASGGDEERR